MRVKRDRRPNNGDVADSTWSAYAAMSRADTVARKARSPAGVRRATAEARTAARQAYLAAVEELTAEELTAEELTAEELTAEGLERACASSARHEELISEGPR